MVKGRFAPLLFIILLGFVANGGLAELTPVQYWKRLLPNTPIPTSIHQLLFTTPSRGAIYNFGSEKDKYDDVASEAEQLPSDPNVVIYFRPNDLHAGHKMKLELIKPVSGVPFLSRRAADSMPFSSAKAADIISRFNLQPGSNAAKGVEKTLHNCEVHPVAREHRVCTTSLESMVDFAIDRLGTHNLATVSLDSGDTQAKEYTVTAVKEMMGGKGGVVACHMQTYPYAVFVCHTLPKTTVYEVHIDGGDGAAVSAAAVCHNDTVAWNPNHVAFKVTKLRHGDGPICHFFLPGSIVWTLAMHMGPPY